jgi:hypothetical protein
MHGPRFPQMSRSADSDMPDHQIPNAHFFMRSGLPSFSLKIHKEKWRFDFSGVLGYRSLHFKQRRFGYGSSLDLRR